MKENMMNCNEIKDNLIFYVEGSLNPDASRKVQKHLDGCDECRSFFLFLKDTLSVIEKEKRRETNHYFSMKVIERLKSQSAANQTFGHIRFARIYKPSMAFFLMGLAIFAGIFLGGSYHKKFEITSFDNSRTNQLQTVADEFYLNDLGIENIETILITENNK